MCPLRRVEGHRAGPSALGILVPPGRPTFLILRPRSLSWDLLLLWPGAANTFRELLADEASTFAGELYHALARWSDAAGRVEEVACRSGRGFQVRVSVGCFTLLLCARRPGHPYQPLIFPDAETARAAAGQLRTILCPADEMEQEVYLNTRHFAN